MIEYKIVDVFARTIEEAEEYLQNKINYWLEKGWKPQGDISLNPKAGRSESMIIACQIMIKEKDNE